MSVITKIKYHTRKAKEFHRDAKDYAEGARRHADDWSPLSRIYKNLSKLSREAGIAHNNAAKWHSKWARGEAQPYNAKVARMDARNAGDRLNYRKRRDARAITFAKYY